MKPANGQALVEFAVFGSLALIALTFMIQMGLRMNFQQEIEQQTFRYALVQAHAEGEEESQAISVQQFRDRQMPNAAQGSAIMPRTMTQAGATVTWGEWLTYLADDRDSQPKIIVNLNGTERDFRSEDIVDNNQPFIREIHKEFGGSSTVTQSNTATSLTTDPDGDGVGTTETTTLALNTNNNDEVVSTVHSEPVRWDWAGTGGD